MAPVQSFFRLTQVPFGLSVSVNKMIFPSSVSMSFAFQRYLANISPCFYFREILDSSESPFCSIRTHFSLSDLLQSHNHWWEHAQNLQTFTIFFCVSFVLAEYSISAAAIAIFSVGFAIIGTICVLLSFQKKRDYLLKPASMFYTFAGTRVT